MKGAKKRSTDVAAVVSPLNVTITKKTDNDPLSEPVVVAPVSVPVAPVKVRSGRKKSFPVVAVVGPNGIQGSLTPEKRKPLIAHLPFSSTEVAFHDGPIRYDPQPPGIVEAFDSMEGLAANITDVYSGPLKEEGKDAVETAPEEVAPISIVEPMPVFTRADLNLYSREHGQVEVPEKTDIACFWCAHQFEGRPVFLPYDEKDGVWHVYGNFCCPECALAYCLEEKEDQQVRWEKVALLHRMYANIVGGRIYPSPARIVLRHFGGKMSIEEYRATVRRGKVRVDIHYPPMVSLLATMDTKPIDFYETTIPKSFVPLNTERVRKVEEGLRLKRTKPLKDRDSTLDACMNLQIRRS